LIDEVVKIKRKKKKEKRKQKRTQGFEKQVLKS